MMNYKRKLLGELINWKSSPNKKPLMLRGARQVGKSTLINDFGKEYKYYISLNLEKSKDLDYFQSYGDDVDDILNVILLNNNIKRDLGNTLLFIDEIQESPQAIKLLRYFYEELPELDVISAGSLLEFAIANVESFPVGRINQMALHPMDFEEFLMALGEDVVLGYFRQIPVPDLAFEKLLDLFNTYILVGGMPEVVKAYINNGTSLVGLATVYSSIWDNYLDDVEKYAQNQTERRIIRHIMAAAPTIRDRVTFVGFGNSSYRSREVSEAFSTLNQAKLIRTIYPTNDLKPPIVGALKRKPKIQFLDTGLLNYAADIQTELLKVRDFNSIYRGYIVNHVAIQELIASKSVINYAPRFWVRENSNSNAEVDIVYAYKSMLIPIEVKSGAKGRLRSLHEFIDRTDHNYGIRILANKLSMEEGTTRSGKVYKLLNLPYFCIGRVDHYIEWFVNQ
ncbi:MAG: putative AAA+ superfamily ATPase [Saprospiraceae bacterium]|jgi:predicted AAA+ superfamily ATPase